MITIGYDFDKNEMIEDSGHELNEAEAKILEYIMDHLECDFPQRFKIVANSSNYTTLEYKGVDLVRLKYTPKAQWIKIHISNEDNKTQKDNPIFANQKNKYEAMWKCSVDDLDELYPFLQRAMQMIDSWH